MNTELHDKPLLGPPDGHEDIWELIPWYVNGSMPADQSDRIETHTQTCMVCAREVDRQRDLAQEVGKTELFEVPLERSWDTLRAAALADIAARTPAPKPQTSWMGLARGQLATLFGTVAIACVALVVVVQTNGPGADDFVTLTAAPDADGRIIKFQATGTPSTQELAALGVLSITGPSEAGVYAATVAEDADAMAIARAMMAREDILFAAPEISE